MDLEVRLVPIDKDGIDGLMPMVEEYYRFDGHRFEPESARRAIVELLEHPEWGSLRFIEEAGARVGYLILIFSFSLEFLGKDGLVDEIFLDESSRGRGVGTQALRLACEEARALGVKALHLEVRRDNVHAHRAYERAGFVKREAFFLMSKRL